MRNNIVTATKYFILSIFTALAVASTTVSAQGPPIFPDGSKIEGTWNMQVRRSTCDDFTPILSPFPDLRSYADGGVSITFESQVVCRPGEGDCTSLGVWKHLGGRSYVSAVKRLRLDPVTSSADGSVITVSSMMHEVIDTLTVNDVLRFYDLDGVLEDTLCRTGTGTRFTGEN
jgi:hypothetical protein